MFYQKPSMNINIYVMQDNILLILMSHTEFCRQYTQKILWGLCVVPQNQCVYIIVTPENKLWCSSTCHLKQEVHSRLAGYTETKNYLEYKSDD